jgi:hypothetical protein
MNIHEWPKLNSAQYNIKAIGQMKENKARAMSEEDWFRDLGPSSKMQGTAAR